MKTKLLTLLSAAICIGGPNVLTGAQSPYFVDVSTVVSSSDPTFTPRFFRDFAFTQPAPLNTVIWFVASVDNRVPTNANGGFGPSGVLGSDDTLVRQVTIDGSAGGQLGPGFLVLDPFPVASTFSNQSIFVYVWSQTTTQTNIITPVIGDHFGILPLGIRPPPEFGNADWSITQSISVGIPEPSILWLAGIGALCLILKCRSPALNGGTGKSF